MKNRKKLKIVLPAVLILTAVLFLTGRNLKAGKGGSLLSRGGAGTGTVNLTSLPDAGSSSGITELSGAGSGAADKQATAVSGQAKTVKTAEKAAAPQSAASAVPADSADERKLIRTVSLSLETTDFENLLAELRAGAAADGGYIEKSSISGTASAAGQTAAANQKKNSSVRTASLTFRIPAANADAFLSAAEGKANVVLRTENTSDITLQYSDTESHIKTLKTEQERLWALLEKAENTQAVISIEQRLTDIEYQLNSYESKIRLYDNQTDYVSVTMSIREVKTYTPAEKAGMAERMEKGLRATLLGIKNAAEDLLVGLVVWFPVLLILGALTAVVLVIIKHIPAGKRKQPLTSSDTAGETKA
jgi:uncharacterized protein YeeX (DUF496 family)